MNFIDEKNLCVIFLKLESMDQILCKWSIFRCGGHLSSGTQLLGIFGRGPRGIFW